MFNMGAWDWGIVLLIVLVLFGSAKLPQLAKGIGKSISSFKAGLKDIESEVKENPEEKKSKDKEAV